MPFRETEDSFCFAFVSLWLFETVSVFVCVDIYIGVEDVTTDCKTSKVVVKGEKADPLNVLERVEMKSHRKVELISPIPKPKTVEEKKPEEKEKPKPEEKKEEVLFFLPFFFLFHFFFFGS
jgi:hypothetical protein